ncbi:MAG: ribonuclease H-like domain-containing protein [Acidimicrobiales bacterium]
MARAPSKRRWVTKTDLTRYARCPYAFWVLDTGQLTFAQSVTPQQAGLIDAGVAFQRQVEARAQPVEVADVAVDLPALFASESLTLFLDELPTLVNTGLALRGRPDGVRTEAGALIPIETKSHRDVLATDRLELAFYWLLLEPYRTRSSQPRGVLILRRDDAPVEVEVELLPRHFDEVRRIVDEVRRARRYGVQPRICSCSVCAGPMRDEVLRRAHHGRDLTLIWKIGPVLAGALEALGIASYGDLRGCDQAELLAALRADKRSVSAAMVAGWCHHAESYARAEAVLFGSPAPLPSSFIVLDLEYGPHTWLIGACIVDGERRRTIQLWADTPAEERQNLRQLARLVDEHPSLPLVTWNGLSADLPELRRTAKRLRLGKLVDSIVTQHVDLFAYAAGAVRLPVPGLSLSEVAAYFGVAKVSAVQGGFDAQMRYLAYAGSQPGPERDGLRDELLEYNRDDLVGLVAAAEGFRRLAPALPSPPIAPAA